MIKRFLYILIYISLLINTAISVPAPQVKDNYASSSVLASGKWFRMAVLVDGIYRIDFTKLKQIGLGDPAKPRIFANNFGQLSYYNNDPKPDDLREVSIHLVKGSDGIFNEGDYLLFFGQGTGRWKYNSSTGEYDHRRHNYSDTAYYFITSGEAGTGQIASIDEPQGDTDYYSSESDGLFIHEKETENLIKSGREWYQPVSVISGLVINPGLTDIVPGEKIRIGIRVLARSPAPTIFRLYEGTQLQKSIQVQSVNMLNYTGTYAQITDSSGTIVPLSSAPVFELKFFNNGEPGARGWLDYVKLQVRKNNNFKGITSIYSDARSVGPGRLTEFTIKSPSENPEIWDISDPVNPAIVNYRRTGENIKFKAYTSALKYYIIFKKSEALQPLIRTEALPNQDLHGSEPAEMIIVTHPIFRDYAEKLASLHYKNSGLISQIVTPGEIYNEFSGGIPDLVAIRNFTAMKFRKQSGTKTRLQYLLLFGDGSYENRTPPPRNPNFIPTYQSLNSNVIISSFTSDDFYSLLEDGEGESEGSEDIGIGRLPVSDTTQAGIVVRKITRYLDPGNGGAWKNIICFTADDEDNNTHLYDAESLAGLVETNEPVFNTEKIYFDAFRQESSVNGQSYPDVTNAINNRINAGCLIFNYTGHGNENGLSHERAVKTEDINSWNNGDKLPLFITATCEFSRFDDIDINLLTREMTGRTSAGEKVLLNEKGGGIALMSTTRLVYSAPNYFLNKNIFNFAFNPDSSGNALRLGDIIRLAKNNSGTGLNKRNFSLLGDPALRLAYPWHGRVVTDSINSVSVSEDTDTLKALVKITISGHIEDLKGEAVNSFNGIISPLVFDKQSVVKTLANDGGQSVNFNLRNNILFSGKTKAVNGRFRFTFIVPRDINYSYGPGKISYYADDGAQDMNGFYSEIIVGGFSEITVSDTTGPAITVYMNDTLFRSGGITDSKPRLLAIIEDNGGINTTGSGIGHDLTAYLDNDPKKSYILNNYFESDFDSFIKGKVIYDLSGLVKGRHTITVKAWDNFNNSSEESIIFLVEEEGKFVLRNLMNYPNPVIGETRLSAEHNRPGEDMEITITIYDLNGRVIRVLKSGTFSSGYQLEPVIWDGNASGGQRVGRGIYPYRATVRSGSGETATGSGRMIIL